MGGDAHSKLSVSERELLEGQFSEEEVFQVVKECCSFKAPGPDGFNFHFISRHQVLMVLRIPSGWPYAFQGLQTYKHGGV